MNEHGKTDRERCYEAAAKSGYIANEAEKCEKGDMDCPVCPWNPEDFFNKEMRGEGNV